MHLPGASWPRGEVSLELALQLAPAPWTCPGQGCGHPECGGSAQSLVPLEGELSPSRMGHHRLYSGCVAPHTPLHPAQTPASPCYRKTVSG